VVANAVAAINNLVFEPECRKALASAGGIEKLLTLLSQMQLPQQQQQQQQPADAASITAGDANAAAVVSIANRPSLSLMSEAHSVADSLVSQPDSWLCPMSSVAPLVNNAAVVIDV
jgi:hypothetical protein